MACVRPDESYYALISFDVVFGSGFLTYILSNKEIHSRSYVSFKVNSKYEAECLYSYMKCKLTHILLSMRKQTHNLCNLDVFKWIPLVPLDRMWTNTRLYEYLKLNIETIQFITNIELDGKYD